MSVLVAVPSSFDTYLGGCFSVCGLLALLLNTLFQEFPRTWACFGPVREVLFSVCLCDLSW